MTFFTDVGQHISEQKANRKSIKFKSLKTTYS